MKINPKTAKVAPTPPVSRDVPQSTPDVLLASQLTREERLAQLPAPKPRSKGNPEALARWRKEQGIGIHGQNGPQQPQVPKLTRVPIPRSIKKRRARQLREYIVDLEEQYGLSTGDPVEMLVHIAVVGRDPLLEVQFRKELAKDQGCSPSEVVLGPDELQALLIPLDVRVDAAKASAPFVRPKLAATALVTNEQMESLVDAEMLSDPKYRILVEEMMSLSAEKAPLKELAEPKG